MFTTSFQDLVPLHVGHWGHPRNVPPWGALLTIIFSLHFGHGGYFNFELSVLADVFASVANEQLLDFAFGAGEVGTPLNIDLLHAGGIETSVCVFWSFFLFGAASQLL